HCAGCYSAQRGRASFTKESNATKNDYGQLPPSMIFLKDPQGRYIYINLKFAEFAHRSVNELIGKTDFEIFPHAQAAVFHSNDLKVLEAGVPLEFEEAAVHDDESHIGVVCKFPLFDVEGKIYAIGGIVTDIPERKRAEGA